MSKQRSILLCLLVLLATSATASTSAFATEGPYWLVCEEGSGGGTKYTEDKCGPESSTGEWELNTLATGETRNSLSKSIGITLLKGKVAGVNLTITFEEAHEKGTLHGGLPGTDEGTIKYTKCKVTGPAGCLVKEPITSEVKTQLTWIVRKEAGEKWKMVNEKEEEKLVEEGDEGMPADLTKPASGSTLATIVLESCTISSLNNSYLLTGSMSGAIEGGEETFGKETDELKFAGSEATLTGTMEQELEGGKGLQVNPPVPPHWWVGTARRAAGEEMGALSVGTGTGAGRFTFIDVEEEVSLTCEMTDTGKIGTLSVADRVKASSKASPSQTALALCAQMNRHLSRKICRGGRN